VEKRLVGQVVSREGEERFSPDAEDASNLDLIQAANGFEITEDFWHS
jgi:hypothetical protein